MGKRQIMTMSSSQDQRPRDEVPAIRETRSGLTGFGRRPELHPTWQEPEGEGPADRAQGSSAVVLDLAGRTRRQRR